MVTILAFALVAQCQIPPYPDTVEARLQVYATGACIVGKWQGEWSSLPTVFEADKPFKRVKAERRALEIRLTHPGSGQEPKVSGASRWIDRLTYREIVDGST